MRILLSVSRTDQTWTAVDGEAIAAELNQRGHDVCVVSETCADRTADSSNAERLVKRGIWRQLEHLVDLVRLLRKHNIQVLYQHAQNQTWSVRCAAMLARVPVISGKDALGSSQRPDSETRTLPSSRATVASGTVGRVVSQLEYVFRSTYVKYFRLEIPILCYHRLVASDDDCGKFATHIRAELFERHLRFLRDNNYRTMHFADFESAQIFDITQRSVILTFDDGYEDNYRLLFPLLKKYKAKAVIYLVSGLDRNAWDASRGEQSINLMTHAQRAEMLASGLVEFGAHSVTHADLSDVSLEQADAEIQECKTELEASLGIIVHTFAYPYGRLNRRVKEMVRHSGFRYGIATDSGPLAVHEDPFHIRRIVVYPTTNVRRFRRKVSGGYTFYRTPEK